MTARAPDLSAVRRALGTWKVAHRVQLRDEAVTPRQLRAAEEAGVVRRLRRDWFAAPECDAALIHAVHALATLACVSAAPLHGLWDLEDAALHLCAGRVTPRIDREAPSWPGSTNRELTVHWTRRPEPVLAPRVRAVIVPLRRTLSQIAACQPLERAVVVVDSALRRKKISLEELREVAAADAALAKVVEQANGLADSGIESLARVRLARRGVVMVPQVVLDGHPVDGLIGDRLVLQLDGFGPHSSRTQRNRDLAQDDRLRRMGYIVLRYGGDQVKWSWPMIEAAVLDVVAAGKHLR